MKLEAAARLLATQEVDAYLGGSRQPLYHYTSLTALPAILKTGALVSGGDGWVSFTRDKSYRVNDEDSNVRLTFDADKLKDKGYKFRQFSYNFTSPEGTLLSPQRRRGEAEEQVKGPVRLKDGSVKIELTQEGKAGAKKDLANYEKYLDTWKRIQSLVAKDEFTEEAYRLQSGANFNKYTWNKMKVRRDSNPKWAPEWFTEEMTAKAVKHAESNIARTKYMLENY
jgi:hypothetical protein